MNNSIIAQLIGEYLTIPPSSLSLYGIVVIIIILVFSEVFYRGIIEVIVKIIVEIIFETVPSFLKKGFFSRNSPPINEEEIRNYLDTVINKFGLWRGLGLGRNISLEEIYISHSFHDDSQEKQKSEQEVIIDSNLLERILTSKSKDLLITGLAGGGKTTLLKRWALELANCSLQEIENKDKGWKQRLSLTKNENWLKDNPKIQIPIFLSLGEIGQQCNGNLSWSESIPKLAADKFSSLDGSFPDSLTKSLAWLLDEGKVIILLDGADEVPEVAYINIKRWLERVQITSKSPIVLTSRPISYINQLNNFEVYRLRYFEFKQIKSFIKKWFNSSNSVDVNLGSKLIKELDDQLILITMAQNPLFLTMICIHFEVSGHISSKQGELFEEFIAILLEQWDRERGVKRTRPLETTIPINLKLSLLGSIAYRFFDQVEFPQGELLDFVQQQIKEMDKSIEANQLIQEIESVSGILISDRHGFYRFCHPLFHEFFYARKLVQEDKNGREDWKVWIPKHFEEEKYANIIAFFKDIYDIVGNRME